MILKLELTLPNKVAVLTLYNLRNEVKMEAFQTRFPNHPLNLVFLTVKVRVEESTKRTKALTVRAFVM
jgi:hypothetical protein